MSDFLQPQPVICFPVPTYLPFRNGRYTVAPGLFPLGTDFGNGAADAHLFQMGTEFPRYRENKLRCRAERFEKYVCTADYDSRTAEAVARLMVIRLVTEHPDSFLLEMKPGGAGILHCLRTAEDLAFDSQMRLMDNAFYASTFDALCCQIMEDIAVVRVVPDGSGTGQSDRIVALHLCAPSRWAAEEKIGQSFLAAHLPVAGFERVAAAAEPILRTMVSHPPFTRFAWSIEFTDRLNLHPEAPPDIPESVWKDRRFRPGSRIAPNAVLSETPLFVRVERQVLWGLPDMNAFVFAIRVSLLDGTLIRADTVLRDALKSALLSMSPESLAYKGLTESISEVIAWLSEGTISTSP